MSHMAGADAVADSWLAHLERSPEAVLAVAAALCRCVQALPHSGTGRPAPLSQALGLQRGALRSSAVSLRMLDATQPRLSMVLRRHLLALTVLRTGDGRWAAAGGASTMRMRPWLATLCSAEHSGSDVQVASRAAAAGGWALDIASAARIDALCDSGLPRQRGGDSAVIALCIRRLSSVATAQKRGGGTGELPPQTIAHLSALDGVQRRLMVSELCRHLQYAAPRWRSRLCCALSVFLPFYLGQLGRAEAHEHPENRQQHVDGLLTELQHLVEGVVEVLERGDRSSMPESDPQPSPTVLSPPVDTDVDQQWSEDWSEQQHWQAVLGSAPLLPADDDLSLRDFVLAFLATDAMCLPLLAHLPNGYSSGAVPLDVCTILSRLVLLGHAAARHQQSATATLSPEADRAAKSESQYQLERKVTMPVLSAVSSACESPGRSGAEAVSVSGVDREGKQLAGTLAGVEHQMDEVDEADRYSDSFEPDSDEGEHLCGPFEAPTDSIEAADVDVATDRTELQLHRELHSAASADLCYALVYCGVMLLPIGCLPSKVRECVCLVTPALTKQRQSTPISDTHQIDFAFCV